MSPHLLKKLSIELDSKGLDLKQASGGGGNLRNQEEAVSARAEI